MKIYLATDHAGFELKEKIKKFLIKEGHQVEDLGAFSYDANDDYPRFMHPVAKAVGQCSPSTSSGSKQCFGIVLGGSGQGEAMVANRYKGVRAAVLYSYNKEIIKLSRQHNNANVLALGARFLSTRKALKAIKLWLETPFSGEERHQRRIGMIDPTYASYSSD